MVESRVYWDRVGHKSACPVWGDEEMIESCTCGPAWCDPKYPVAAIDPTVVMNNYLTQADNYYQGLTPTWPVGAEFVDEDYTDAELRIAAFYAQEDNTHKEKKNMATSQRQLELRRARLERELDRAEAELERIANLPEEPAEDSVVSFEKVYEKNGKSYSFVAYHAVQGSWYLSQDGIYGARQPKMTWFDLLEFIGDNTIYLATAWEELV